jgi:DNA-3-methyladenine glycosylase I
MADVPGQTPQSQAMSKALKAEGFTFVGPTVTYAFMQAAGMVNDHLATCPARISEEARQG